MLVLFTKKNIESDLLIRVGIEKFCTLFHVLPFSYDIIREKNKKPRINNDSVYINVSHSNEYSLVAVSTQEVGIDIQYHDDRIDIQKISERFFGKKIADKKIFFDLWAKKESVAKFFGESVLKYLSKDVDARLFYLFHHYSLAVFSRDTEYYFTELI